MKLKWANYPALVKRNRGAGIVAITMGLIGLLVEFSPAGTDMGIPLLVLALITLAYAHGLLDADSIIYKSQRDVNKLKEV